MHDLEHPLHHLDAETRKIAPAEMTLGEVVPTSTGSFKRLVHLTFRLSGGEGLLQVVDRKMFPYGEAACR